MNEEMILSVGGRIGYWQGKLAELVSDIGALKPTMFIGVPRVYDRIYNRIKDKIASAGCIKGLLFKWGFNGKLARLRAGFPSASAAPFWDKLLFSKVRNTEMLAASDRSNFVMLFTSCLLPVMSMLILRDGTYAILSCYL
jgi:long-subunit acyl-CoA synthetase (AMP-forming)